MKKIFVCTTMLGLAISAHCIAGVNPTVIVYPPRFNDIISNNASCMALI